MATKAKLELIAWELVYALREITTANGYPLTIAGVTRPTRFGGDQPTVDKGIVLLQRGAERVEAKSLGACEWMQRFVVQGIRAPSETGELPADTYANEINACIYKAVMAKDQLNGLAIDVKCESIELLEPTTGAFAGVAVQAVVHYTHGEYEPFIDVATMKPVSIATTTPKTSYTSALLVTLTHPVVNDPATDVDAVDEWVVGVGTNPDAIDIVAGAVRLNFPSSLPSGTVAYTRTGLAPYYTAESGQELATFTGYAVPYPS